MTYPEYENYSHSMVPTAIMDGDSLKMGCVAGVRGFEHPVSIARKVMEETVHSILVGEGAEEFARKMGIPEAGSEYMVIEQPGKPGRRRCGRVMIPLARLLWIATAPWVWQCQPAAQI